MVHKKLKRLYPKIHPYNTGMLQVSEIHTIYYEECGNPKGIPILFIHGGPGVGLDPDYRRFFDPKKYRIILFDQRGCGKSTCKGNILEGNTTWDLVQDIEKIRMMFGIDAFIMFGGSWAATLILAYAEKYPDKVLAMVLRGIWLSTQEEITWLYEHGAHMFRPDTWEQYIGHIPKAEQKNILKAYYKRLTSRSKKVQLAAARAWVTWTESTYIFEQKSENEIRSTLNDREAIINAQIECHYFLNNAFLKKDQLIKNIGRVSQIPTFIIQGQYDLCCPPAIAWKLFKSLPDVKMRMVHGPHSSFSNKMIHALVNITDRLYLKK